MTHHHGTELAHQGAFTVIDCVACGFAHVLPVPTAEELDRVYRHDYYNTEKPLYIESLRRDLDWWRLVYGERIARLAEVTDAGRRFIDIGSGPGFCVQIARDSGWDALGIEPSRQAAEHTRQLGCAVIEEFLTPDLAERVQPCHAAHCALVLEHLPDPIGFLACVHRLLVPGGAACFSVPNDFNPFQMAVHELGTRDWWVAPPHHINYFSHRSLAHLLDRSGFEVVEITSSFPIDLFLLMGDNYIGNDEVGRSCHVRRMAFEKALAHTGKADLQRRLYRTFAAEGLGREAVIYARRRT